MKRKRIIIAAPVIFIGLLLFSLVYSDGDGDPADLIEATGADDASAVRRMIAQGANIEQRNVLGDTAVILGAAWRNYDAVKALLDGGANVNARQKNGGARH